MHIVIVGLINDMSCGERPQSFSGGSDPQMTFWVGHMTRFMHDTSLFKLQIFKREADTFVGYFKILTKLYHRDCHDHLDISGCQLVCPLLLNLGGTGLWESGCHGARYEDPRHGTLLCTPWYPWLLPDTFR
jgi:hypothetical protein